MPGPSLQRLPLPAQEGLEDWVLLLTPRLLSGLQRSGARLLYSVSGLPHDHAMKPGDNGQPLWVEEPTSQAAALADFATAPLYAHLPVTWLKHADNAQGHLAVYTPIDRTQLGSGWLGLELRDLHKILALDPVLESTYMLLDSYGNLVSQSPNKVQPRQAHIFEQDFFGLDGSGLLDQNIVLSHAIGTGGLRLIYSIPMHKLLRDSRAVLYRATTVELLFVACVLYGVLLIRRRVLLPAQRQQGALIDSVNLNIQLIANAPIGLALVLHEDGTVLRDNRQAQLWMKHDAQWLSRLARSNLDPTHSDARLDNGNTVRVTAVPLIHQGRSASLCVISDITAQKEVEASLIQARQLAENASQAKTQFLATMSHEIRTPLYGITGTLELLNLTELSTQQKHYMDTLQGSVASLSRTVNDSLDLSRIEAGHVELTVRPFCLVQLADEVIATFTARAEAKGLNIYSIVDSELQATVVGDALRIRQVLDNLVSNAIKFTEIGQVVLRVNSVARENNSAYIVFQVSDTGSGVAKEFIPHLFKPYFRPDTKHSRQVPGTGLGLTICSQLAKLMHGSLNAVSLMGLGTSIYFELSLPLAPITDAGHYPQLAKRLVYVDGPLPEIVANLCKWLRRWGALALPYTGQEQSALSNSILVRTWPPSKSHAEWQGPQVLAYPADPKHAIDTQAAVYFAQPHSVLGIGHAVQTAQQGLTQHNHALASSQVKPLLGLHVLVVDDNAISQLVVEKQLETLGCQTTLVYEAAQALEKADLFEFDAVLTDLNMPALSGYELAKALKQQGYCGPILGMTADAFPDPQQKWQQAGMDCLLIKPLTLNMLHAQLQSAVSKEAI